MPLAVLGQLPENLSLEDGLAVRDVDRQFESAQWATKYVIQPAQNDPNILGNWRWRDIRTAAYLVANTLTVLSHEPTASHSPFGE